MAATMTAASNTFAALSSLAGCNLKELHLKRADGSRNLDTLHATCRSAGLIPADTPDSTPKERYLAVFDAALKGGLGHWILDYVEVVCADRHLTSKDPLEAYLLDGGFIKAWAQACLQRAEQTAETALTVDGAFQRFQNGPLQQHLAQVRILSSILRALDRIRAVASGGSVLAAAAAAAASAAAAGHDRLSVKAELRQAVLLEQAFQVMDWCARQGLADPRVGSTGRFGSYTDWSRTVAARRSRAAPRPLFLDSLLQSLSLSGAYPSASVQRMLHTLLLVVREVDPATWAAKLALLSYFLLDSGVLEGVSSSAAVAELSTTAAPTGAGSGSGSEAALEDLRRTFRLSSGEVGLWQCLYLLDCSVPDAPGSSDPHLGRACALLPSCVSESTPFAFIEALSALGRPDVALAVERGQAGSGGGAGGRGCRTLAEATTLLDIRLRCGLMTDAFTVLRSHTADLAAQGEAPDVIRQHTAALVRRLAAWALETDAVAAAAASTAAAAAGAAAAAAGMDASRMSIAGAMAAALGTAGEVAAAGGAAAVSGRGWLNRLTELPLNATEESVLVSWLAEEADAGRPSGALLPLFFLQRGRVNEATAASGRWDRRQSALSAAGATAPPSSSSTAPGGPSAALLSAAVDAAFRDQVPPNLKNVAVGAAVALPPAPQGGGGVGGGGAVAERAITALVAGHGAAEQGAVGILQGYVINETPDQPAAFLAFQGAAPPPLLTGPVPLPPGPAAAQSPPTPPTTTAGEAQPLQQRPLALPPAAAMMSMSAAGAGGGAPPFASMPLQLPSAAPFRAPPGTPSFVGRAAAASGGGGGPYGIVAPTAGLGGAAAGGGAGGLLFSVGGGSAGCAPPGGLAFGCAPGGGGPAAAAALAANRSSKRSKPNSWL